MHPNQRNRGPSASANCHRGRGGGWSQRRRQSSGRDLQPVTMTTNVPWPTTSSGYTYYSPPSKLAKLNEDDDCTTLRRPHNDTATNNTIQLADLPLVPLTRIVHHLLHRHQNYFRLVNRRFNTAYEMYWHKVTKIDLIGDYRRLFFGQTSAIAAHNAWYPNMELLEEKHLKTMANLYHTSVVTSVDFHTVGLLMDDNCFELFEGRVYPKVNRLSLNAAITNVQQLSQLATMFPNTEWIGMKSERLVLSHDTVPPLRMSKGAMVETSPTLCGRLADDGGGDVGRAAHPWRIDRLLSDHRHQLFDLLLGLFPKLVSIKITV